MEWYEYLVLWLIFVQVVNVFTEDDRNPRGIGMSPEEEYEWELREKERNK